MDIFIYCIRQSQQFYIISWSCYNIFYTGQLNKKYSCTILNLRSPNQKADSHTTFETSGQGSPTHTPEAPPLSKNDCVWIPDPDPLLCTGGHRMQRSCVAGSQAAVTMAAMNYQGTHLEVLQRGQGFSKYISQVSSLLAGHIITEEHVSWAGVGRGGGRSVTDFIMTWPLSLLDRSGPTPAVLPESCPVVWTKLYHPSHGLRIHSCSP